MRRGSGPNCVSQALALHYPTGAPRLPPLDADVPDTLPVLDDGSDSDSDVPVAVGGNAAANGVTNGHVAVAANGHVSDDGDGDEVADDGTIVHHNADYSVDDPETGDAGSGEVAAVPEPPFGYPPPLTHKYAHQVQECQRTLRKYYAVRARACGDFEAAET